MPSSSLLMFGMVRVPVVELSAKLSKVDFEDEVEQQVGLMSHLESADCWLSSALSKNIQHQEMQTQNTLYWQFHLSQISSVITRNILYLPSKNVLSTG